ncbi:MAG: hypothetical protein ACPGVN_01975 [Alphaproteobacteria bacterium]
MKPFKVLLFSLVTSILFMANTVAQQRYEAKQIDLDSHVKSAFQAWLSGDDETALTALSQLARRGNEDAMLILGVLVQGHTNNSPFLRSLSFKERNKFKWGVKDGKKKKWLELISGEYKEFANALVRLPFTPNPGKQLQSYELLLRLGESNRAGKLLIGFTQHYNDPETTQKILNTGYDIRNLYEIWLKVSNTQKVGLFWRPEGTDPTLAPQSPLPLFQRSIRSKTWRSGLSGLEFLAGLHYGRSQHGEWPQVVDAGGFENFRKLTLATHPEAQGFKNICALACKNSQVNCRKTLFNLTYVFASSSRFQTPLQSLISNEAYEQTIRYEISLKSSLGITQDTQNSKISDLDQCTLDYLKSSEFVYD